MNRCTQILPFYRTRFCGSMKSSLKEFLAKVSLRQATYSICYQGNHICRRIIQSNIERQSYTKICRSRCSIDSSLPQDVRISYLDGRCHVAGTIRTAFVTSITLVTDLTTVVSIDKYIDTSARRRQSIWQDASDQKCSEVNIYRYKNEVSKNLSNDSSF